ncbi:ABC transporter permease [soil metagenome]
MLKNYLKIALRNLLKNPVYSFINIVGLAVGIACCLLIMLYVQNEWSYDSFHTNSDQLYRAWVHEDYGDDEIYFKSTSPVILAQTLENNIPEVEMVTRRYVFTNLVKLPDQSESFFETVTMVDPAFLDMFDFQLLEGNAESVFNNPGSVLLTENMAREYFGDENPLQEAISIRIGDTFENFTVTGIIQDPPSNSSIQYNFLIPFSNISRFFSENAQTSWFSVSTETYVLLHEQASSELIEPKLVSMMQTALGDLYGADFAESGLIYTVGLQPITDIRLNTDIPEGIAAVSNPVFSYILAAIAFLILLIASVNFMTLSISRSSSRSKEVGIRKTIGAARHQLMCQYWGEALLLTVLAFGVGLVLAEILLPHFNLLSGTELSLTFSGYSLLFWGLAAVFISLLSGIYPALVLSGFKPVDVLKGRLNLSADKNYFRQSMVVFQFTLTIALVAATLVISNQLDYMRSTDLGYDKEQVVVLGTGLSTGPQISLLDVLEEARRVKSRVQSEAGRSTDINQVGMSSYTPVQPGGWVSADFREPGGRKRDFHFNIVDHDFVDLYQIEVLQGRNFLPNDQRAIMVNQALVDDYGWENPIGQKLPGQGFEDHEIIGMVANFHYESLHSTVKPLALTINPSLLFSGVENQSFSQSPNPRISLRLNTDNLPETMTRIEGIWNSVMPGTPFIYTFVDQAVDMQYLQEERLSSIVAFGSALAVIIACMGLFGLVSLMIVRRTKEIGIRKVMGASAICIVVLLNKEFTKLVAISFIIAMPIGWLALSHWLNNFAYRIELGIGVFLLSGIAALLVVWITSSSLSAIAALMNPVKSLRSE